MSAASADSAPGGAGESSPRSSAQGSPTSSAGAPRGWIVRREDAAADAGALAAPESVRVFGLTPEERLRRALERAGCREVRRVTADALPRADAPVVALRDDVWLEERLVDGLARAPGTWLVDETLGALGFHARGAEAPALAAALARGADPPAGSGLRRVAPSELAPAYVAKLRKRQAPYALAARPELVTVAEARIFDASYKGLTDLVTKWVWPRPAASATRWCARRGVHPNSVTLWSWVLAAAAGGLFAAGAFLPGLVLAWLMTFLDTVDGKLARVTLTSSRLGDVLDHGLDLLHPPLWWLAWGFALGPDHALATALVVGGYVVGRLLEGAFLALFGFEIHSWRPADGLFRTLTARRNPNLILLSVATLGGRPDLGLAMVALWTVASLAFHALRLAQAAARRRRGEEVAPWEGA